MAEPELISHVADVKKYTAEAIERALESVGITAEGYAKFLCPKDTGRLQNSITHVVDDKAVYIGTNVEYAGYVEMGTGKYVPNGRKTPWRYKDDKGWHITSGMPPRPYLKPAVTDHREEYRRIIENEFK